MTESTAPAPDAPAQPETASFFEDWIDIFYAPSAVFRRREHANPWWPLLTVVVVLGVLSFLTFSTMQPIAEAEMMRAMAKQQLTPEQIDRAKTMGMAFARWGAVFFFPIAIVFLALVCWLLGKAFGSKQEYGPAVTMVSYAYAPRVIGVVLVAVQGLVMDMSKLTAAAQITISPARFLDPATANPMLTAVLSRLDVFILWETVLLAIGVYVMGKITKENAVVFGIVLWLLGTLPALRTAYSQM